MIWIILLLCSLGFFLLWRVPLCPPGSIDNAISDISLIIPARNEEKNIKKLLISINNLTIKPLEVIVVDDESTDQTANVAKEFGATVLTSSPLPDEWRGKTWACWQGAQFAKGKHFLFLDADTVLKADAFERINQVYGHDDCKVLSLGPYHEMKYPYEQLSAFFNLLTYMGMGSFSLIGSPDNPKGLFGPFFLIERDIYQSVGGHKIVKEEILEHMSLCSILKQKKYKMRCLGGKGVVHTRMYPNGLFELIEGWAKAFATGATKTERSTLILSIIWITGGMLAFTLSCFYPFVDFISSFIFLAYFAYALSLYYMLKNIGQFSFWACLLYPILLLAFFYIFGRSAWIKLTKKQVRWKKRSIALSNTREN